MPVVVDVTLGVAVAVDVLVAQPPLYDAEVPSHFEQTLSEVAVAATLMYSLLTQAVKKEQSR